MSFGPQLPPGFKKPTPEDDSGDEAGPIGPALPPGLARKPSGSRKDSSGSEEDDSIGPALPPGFRKPSGTADGCSSNGQRSVGPSLPPEGASISSSRRLVNTTEDSEDDDDVVGPVLPGSSNSTQQRQLEARAKRLRDQAAKDAAAEGDGKVKKRETWMLEMPEEKAQSFGLGPRQFSKGAAKPKRDSSWTDTPEDRARKAALAADGGVGDKDIDPSEDKDVIEYMAGLKRDQEMEKTAKALKEKRGESLYDSHQSKKAKKEKSASSAPAVRRPFDREQDLQVNRFDDAAKAAMLKKARKMDERFVSGQNKFI